MRSYSKVSPRLWTGSLGKRLRGDAQAQALAAYLVSGPHANMIGLYYLPVGYITHDLGWTAKAAAKSLGRLIDEGYIRYDEEHERVWVVENARIEFGSSLKAKDNRRAGTQNLLADHSNSILVREFLARYGEVYGLSLDDLPSPPCDPFEAPSKPLRSQKQEQKQEQGQGQDSTETSSPARSAPLDARSALFGEGLQVVTSMTGKPEDRCRPLLGKWLKAAGDDAGRLLALLRQASADRRADLVSWIEACLKESDAEEAAYRGAL